MKNSLILVCGAAATGKSTLVNEILKMFPDAYNCRPSDVYLKLAKERNIPMKDAFSEIDDKEAALVLSKLCEKYGVVIGDHHMAIQYEKDSLMAAGDFSKVCDQDETYVPSLSDEYMRELVNSELGVFLILLTGDAEVIYERAKSRYSKVGQYIRNSGVEDTRKELVAEETFFNDFLEKYKIDGCVIDVTVKSKEEVSADALRQIDEYRRKGKKKVKWTGELSSN